MAALLLRAGRATHPTADPARAPLAARRAALTRATLPAAAALLVISYDALFAGNAVAFLLSAALVLSVTLPHRKPADTARPGFIEATTFGIRTYLRTPRLLGLLALSLAVAAASAMVIHTSPHPR